MIRRPKEAARGDALARRHIAQWRRITGRLQVLLNTGDGVAVLADEAHALSRQCERLASTLAHVSASARRARSLSVPDTSKE